MYLKRLELRGFKTFALYTDFVFDAGMTAVVGPNGSGKSNIADGVRWVLGEQSYSVLRGKRTEDMIFAGTSRRPQLGMAEATLTFDNSSNWLPIDFGEVTIARRAYRSGENEYLLNGSRVRLRDITELLGKGGLSRGGFTVIGQGLVDTALSLRAEERRTLFEEAAGIHVYREKRDDALNKLAETQQNMLRSNDILNEIAPRLRDLERQAKRAEERQILQSDLETLLRLWYGYHWRRLQERLADAEAGLHRRQEEVNVGRARLQELEALIASTQSRQNELRRQLSIWHKASGDLHGKAEVNGRELAVSRERLSLLQQRRTELEAELNQAQTQRSGLLESLSGGQQEHQRLQAEAQAHGKRLQEARAEVQHTQATRVREEQALDKARDESYRLASALADAHNRLKQLEERRTQLASERDRQRHDLVDIERQTSTLDNERTRLEGEQATLQRSLEEGKTLEARLQQRLATLQEAVQERQAGVSEAQRQQQRAEDRREMLSGLRQNLAGFGPGVKAVLEAGDSLPGMIGPVAGLLRVPQKLERAVEVALGTHTQSLVVERWEDASRAIDLLRKRSAGRATFLPLDSLKAQPPDKFPSGAGVLGLAHELVEYEPRFAVVVQLLLGSVVIVEDLPTARRLRSQLRGGQRLVTLSGEIVRASGMLTGGSEGARSSLLAQEREWRELPQRLEGLQSQLTKAQEALAAAEHELQACRRESVDAANEQARLMREHEAKERALSALQQKRERLQQETLWRRRLDEQQAREVATLEEKLTTLQAEGNARAQESAAKKVALDGLLATVERARQTETAARDRAAEAESAAAVALRQARLQEQLLANHKANLERLEQENASRAARVSRLRGESDELAAAVDRLQAEASALSAQTTELATRLDPAEVEVVALESQMLGLEKELTRTRQRLSETEVLHNQQVLERERQQDALESMEQRIEEDLGDIEYPTERVQQLRLEFVGQNHQVLAASPALPESIDGDIRDLKARLRRLGGVNPTAPQEYQELQQRHTFLTTQMSDLQESSASLQKVIKDLDEVMEREFLAVFEAAAKQFSYYFELLFGGGQARLLLLEPENPSTSGVEIIARPPGKRPQSLALLSGGERTLTATALLFAVLKVKPIPFCILDEVDAMLDEANVGRFRDLLKELTAQTQFIVISHNRNTIEAANTIYGISMTEEGVSKAISLQLKDAARSASPAVAA